MKINTFTVASAVHLINTASSYDSEDLTCWADVYTCECAALNAVKKGILKAIKDNYEGSDLFDDDTSKLEADEVFQHGDRNEVGFEWSWESADRCIIWRLIRGTLEIGGMADEDTVSRLLTHCASDDCEAHVED